MTLSDEAKLIRRSVAQLRPGRGRKYTPALRRRILGWVDRAKQTGMLECDCSNALGIPQHRFEVWREYAQRSQAMAPAPEPKPAEPMALVPVELAPDISRGIQLGSYGLALVSPRGWRVEGLSVEQAFALLREFE